MTSHVPVLLEECLALLNPQSGRAYLDCTFGGGGHSTAILERAVNITLDAMDRDPAALERAQSLLQRFPKNFRFHSEDFRSPSRPEWPHRRLRRLADPSNTMRDF